MKTHPLTTSLLIILTTIAVHAGKPEDNLVVNGDFESGEKPAFYGTMPWYNCGTGLNQGTNARSSEGTVISGAFSAIVNDRYNIADAKFGPIAHTQKTKHTIEEGDSFSLSYQWLPADRFWQTTRDTVRFVLYATDNDKIGGTKVWTAEFNAGFFRGTIGAPMSVQETTDVVNEEAVGKTLFVQFYGLDTVDGETGSPHFARVDDIVVTVQSKGKSR